MGTVTTQACARVGLLGNPSDIYGGRGLGFALTELGVRLELSDRRAGGTTELPELLAAGWRTFCRALGLDPEDRDFEISFQSDIPFQAGLSGSSAILVAALRAFAEHCGHPLQADRLAELAWRAEAEELGIRAGPLDRQVQAHGGLLWMDWSRAFEPGAVERLDAALLPPLLVAWHAQPGQPSSDVHAPVYARWRSGDAEVVGVMRALAAGADEGRRALETGDLGALCAAVDHNFDLRAQLFPIAPRDRSLIALGRAHGAATKFCGSGGSVLAIPRGGGLDELRQVFEDAGFLTLIPRVENPRHA